MMKNEPEMQHYFGKISDTTELEKAHPRLKAAFDFLKRKGLATLACGTYELEGGAPGEKAAVFAMVQEVDLKAAAPRGPRQVHRRPGAAFRRGDVRRGRA